MAKNKNKQAKFKEIVCKVQTSDFKKALNNVLLHIYRRESQYSIINGVKFHIENDFIEMTATDGNTMLKATVGLDETIKGAADIILSGLYLSKMKLEKDYTSNKRSYGLFDILEITIKEDEALISNKTNGVTYRIPKVTGQYPDTEKILNFKYDEKKHFKVAINPALIARFKDLPNKGGLPIIMFFEKDNPLQAIHIESDALDAGDYSGVLMPCKIRE